MFSIYFFLSSFLILYLTIPTYGRISFKYSLEPIVSQASNMFRCAYYNLLQAVSIALTLSSPNISEYLLANPDILFTIS
nr:MAG TPA: copper resistance protein [Caudoviricetes sp.]